MNERKKRLTYLMLFRVGVVTLLLIATFVSELAGPSDQPVSPRTRALLALIAVTYGLTIVFSLWIERGGARLDRARRFALVQVATDLVLTTALVHLTGGVESGFAFMYLLVIVWSSFVLEQSAIGTAAAAVALYAGVVALRRAGLLPLEGAAGAMPLRDALRAIGVNAVAFAATGVLASRLSIELRRAGESLESQGLRLRDLATLHADVIDGLTSGLVTLSREGEVITCNAAAAEILGVDAERVIEQHVDQVMPSLHALLDAVGDESPLRRGEMTHVRGGGGERILGVSISPLVDSRRAVRGRIVSFQDLTELRRMEEAVTRSERLAAVGRLAAGVAHEIRNPLAAISGSIELLAAGGPEPREAGELMAIVLRETARLNALITDLLDFARPRAPEPERLELGAALAEMVQVFQHDKQQGGATLELRAPEPVWAAADPAQLRQIVWNLLRNAAQASPPGAAVAVEVDLETAGAQKWARLTVRDRGAGILPEHRARIFEPFFSTKQGGTGLGLATVHRIVEDHHGRIEVEPADGGGTRVTVRLPTALR
jgi:two-component system sensor histidine kinase PilS (NtrC family)